MTNMIVEKEELKKELVDEKLQNYLSILINSETELLYQASPDDIPLLMKSKGLAMISLINLGFPYTCKNGLVYMVIQGIIYSIRTDYLLKLDENLILKDDNRLEDMLPSLYLHKATEASLNLFEKEDALTTEGSSAKEDELIEDEPKEEIKTSGPKNLRQVISEEKKVKNNLLAEPIKAKPIAAKEVTTKIEEFALKDYSYNCFDLKLKDKDGNIVAKDVTITTFLIDKENEHFVAIVETENANKRKYKSVFFCLKDKSIVVPIRLVGEKKSCKICISFENIEITDKDFTLSFDRKGNTSKREIPSWKGIFAFPYSIKGDSKGGVLVGKTKTGYETYQSDFKKGNITIKRNGPDGKILEFNVLVSFINKKVILEMIN